MIGSDTKLQAELASLVYCYLLSLDRGLASKFKKKTKAKKGSEGLPNIIDVFTWHSRLSSQTAADDRLQEKKASKKSKQQTAAKPRGCEVSDDLHETEPSSSSDDEPSKPQNTFLQAASPSIFSLTKKQRSSYDCTSSGVFRILQAVDTFPHKQQYAVAVSKKRSGQIVAVKNLRKYTGSSNDEEEKNTKPKRLTKLAPDPSPGSGNSSDEQSSLPTHQSANKIGTNSPSLVQSRTKEPNIAKFSANRDNTSKSSEKEFENSKLKKLTEFSQDFRTIHNKLQTERPRTSRSAEPSWCGKEISLINSPRSEKDQDKKKKSLSFTSDIETPKHTIINSSDNMPKSNNGITTKQNLISSKPSSVEEQESLIESDSSRKILKSLKSPKTVVASSEIAFTVKKKTNSESSYTKKTETGGIHLEIPPRKNETTDDSGPSSEESDSTPKLSAKPNPNSSTKELPKSTKETLARPNHQQLFKLHESTGDDLSNDKISVFAKESIDKPKIPTSKLSLSLKKKNKSKFRAICKPDVYKSSDKAPVSKDNSSDDEEDKGKCTKESTTQVNITSPKVTSTQKLELHYDTGSMSNKDTLKLSQKTDSSSEDSDSSSHGDARQRNQKSTSELNFTLGKTTNTRKRSTDNESNSSTEIDASKPSQKAIVKLNDISPKITHVKETSSSEDSVSSTGKNALKPVQITFDKPNVTHANITLAKEQDSIHDDDSSSDEDETESIQTKHSNPTVSASNISLTKKPSFSDAPNSSICKNKVEPTHKTAKPNVTYAKITLAKEEDSSNDSYSSSDVDTIEPVQKKMVKLDVTPTKITLKLSSSGDSDLSSDENTANSTQKTITKHNVYSGKIIAVKKQKLSGSSDSSYIGVTKSNQKKTSKPRFTASKIASLKKPSLSDASFLSDHKNQVKPIHKTDKPNVSYAKITLAKEQDSSNDTYSSSDEDTTAQKKIAAVDVTSAKKTLDRKPSASDDSYVNNDENTRNPTQKTMTKHNVPSSKIAAVKKHEISDNSDSSSVEDATKSSQKKLLKPHVTVSKVANLKKLSLSEASDSRTCKNEVITNHKTPKPNVTHAKITLAKEQDSSNDTYSSSDEDTTAQKKIAAVDVTSAKKTLDRKPSASDDSYVNSDQNTRNPTQKTMTKHNVPSSKIAAVKKHEISDNSDSSSVEDATKSSQKKLLKPHVTVSKVANLKKLSLSEASDSSTCKNEVITNHKTPKPNVTHAKITLAKEQDSSNDTYSSSDEDTTAQKKIAAVDVTSAKKTLDKKPSASDDSFVNSVENTRNPTQKTMTKHNVPSSKIAAVKKHEISDISDSSSVEDATKSSQKKLLKPHVTVSKVANLKKPSLSEASDSSTCKNEVITNHKTPKPNVTHAKITLANEQDSSNDTYSSSDEDKTAQKKNAAVDVTSAKKTLDKKPSASDDSYVNSDENTRNPTQKTMTKHNVPSSKIAAVKKHEISDNSDSSSVEDATKSSQKKLLKPHVTVSKVANLKKPSLSEASDSSTCKNEVITNHKTPKPNVTHAKITLAKDSSDDSDLSSEEDVTKPTQKKKTNSDHTSTKMTPSKTPSMSGESDSSRDENKTKPTQKTIPKANMTSTNSSFSKESSSSDDSDSSSDDSESSSDHYSKNPIEKISTQSNVTHAKISLDSKQHSSSYTDLSSNKDTIKLPKVTTTEPNVSAEKKTAYDSNDHSDSSIDEDSKIPCHKTATKSNRKHSKVMPIEDANRSIQHSPRNKGGEPERSMQRNSNSDSFAATMKGVTSPENRKEPLDYNPAIKDSPSKVRKRKRVEIDTANRSLHKSQNTSEWSHSKATKHSPKCDTPTTSIIKMITAKKKEALIYSESSSDEDFQKSSESMKCVSKPAAQTKMSTANVSPSKKKKPTQDSDSSSEEECEIETTPQMHEKEQKKKQSESFKTSVQDKSKKRKFSVLSEQNQLQIQESNDDVQKRIKKLPSEDKKLTNDPNKSMCSVDSPIDTSKSNKTSSKNREKREDEKAQISFEIESVKKRLQFDDSEATPSQKSPEKSTPNKTKRKRSDTSENVEPPLKKATILHKEKSDAEDHRSPHGTKTKATFKCSVCDKQVSTAGSLKRHLEIHSRGEVTPRKKDHGKSVHSESTSSSDENSETEHTKSKAPFRCSICDRQVGSAESLKRNLKIHSGSANVSPRRRERNDSNHSEWTSSSENEVQTAHHEHNKGDTPTKIKADSGSYKCHICYKLLATKSGLKRHLQIHTRRPSRIHEEVVATLAEGRHKDHGDSTPEVKDTDGDHKEKSFNVDEQQKSIDKHARKTHECHLCGKSLASTSSLKRHSNIHTRQRDKSERRDSATPNKADVGKLSPDDSYKKDGKDEEKIANKKLFNCPVCEKQLSTPATLKRHLNIHSRLKGGSGNHENRQGSGGDISESHLSKEDEAKKQLYSSEEEDNLQQRRSEEDQERMEKKQRREEKKEKLKNKSMVQTEESNGDEACGDRQDDKNFFMKNKQSDGDKKQHKHTADEMKLHKDDPLNYVEQNRKNNNNDSESNKKDIRKKRKSDGDKKRQKHTADERKIHKDDQQNYIEQNRKINDRDSVNIAHNRIIKEVEAMETESDKLHLHQESKVSEMARKKESSGSLHQYDIESTLECEQKQSESEPPTEEHSKSDEKTFKCTICDKGLATASSLKRHLRIHSRNGSATKLEEPKNTGHSGTVDVTDDSMQESKKIVESRSTYEKYFKCLVCDKQLISSGSLKRHSKIHTGSPTPRRRDSIASRSHVSEKSPPKLSDENKVEADLKMENVRGSSFSDSFMCSVCDKRFESPKKLIRHSKIHTLEESQPERAFSHLRNQSDVSPFECTICNEVFSTTSNMKRHSRTHDGTSSVDLEATPSKKPKTSSSKVKSHSKKTKRSSD